MGTPNDLDVDVERRRLASAWVAVLSGASVDVAAGFVDILPGVAIVFKALSALLPRSLRR